MSIVLRGFILFFISCLTIHVYAKNIILHDSEGRAISFNDFKNKWIIVNYWAEWCEGCVEEVPELNNFYQKNQDRNIIILGVNYDHLPRPYLNQVIKKMDIRFPVLLEDPN